MTDMIVYEDKENKRSQMPFITQDNIILLKYARDCSEEFEITGVSFVVSEQAIFDHMCQRTQH